jgi:hypothetical protein
MMLRDQQMRRPSSRLSVESTSQSKPPHASKIWKRRRASLPEAKWAVGTFNALGQPLQAVMQGPRGTERFSRFRRRIRYRVAGGPIRLGECCAWVVVGVVFEFLRLTFIVVLVANETPAWGGVLGSRLDAGPTSRSTTSGRSK